MAQQGKKKQDENKPDQSDEKATERQAADDTPETPESHGEHREAAASVLRSGDRVAAVSYRKDGKPDQSDDYVVKR